MFQRCYITDTSSTPIQCHDSDEEPGFPIVGTARPISECEWRPFDLIQKRSGPHNLNRLGYNEEKCRNVLVRFCAHVPRNFQYKDGIQQIFLILREHLGDENLDLAGGVLYELIEVDCEHTDDPGAAFQRWRHDHMYRYADLELPHIPHMTTITSSIVPTERLSRWRSEHADRYRFVLSDSSPLAKRDYIDPSCIRNKKAWLIDHTLFISNRSEGTRPMCSPNPQEFHEMQWDPEYRAAGRFVEERELPITSLDRPSEASPPSTADTFVSPKSRSQLLRHSLSSISIIEKFVEKLGKQKKAPEAEQRRRSWMPNSLVFDSNSLLKDRRAHCGMVSVPWPEGCQIPNAIFARKFLIVDTGENLPSHLPISQMPTAESKATETIVEAATTGLLSQASPWLFRGPFTPQLGFDGGLDYQWSPQDASIMFRRFDLEAPLSETSHFNLDCSSRGGEYLGYDGHAQSQQSSSKRGGRVFDKEYAAEVKSCAPTRGKPDEASLYRTRDEISLQNLPISVQYTSNKSARSSNKTSDIAREYLLERREKHHQNVQLFDNIEFTVQTEPQHECTSVTNRQITIVERPGQGETVHDITTGRPGRLRGPRNSAKNQLKSPTNLRNSNTACIDTQETTREFLLSNMQQEAPRLQVDANNSRQVSHRVTGEILQPLRYNASGGRKRGERRRFVGDIYYLQSQEKVDLLLGTARVGSPMVLYDPEREKILRSLQPRSEICAEENQNRVANRRFSDIFPLRRATVEGQVNSRLFDYNNPVNGDVAYYDSTSPRIGSAPLPGKINHHLADTCTTKSLHPLSGQNTPDYFNFCDFDPSPQTPLAGRFIATPTSQYLIVNTTIGGDPFLMTGAHIPPCYPELHPCHPLASNLPGINPAAPSYIPREDSDSSLVSLGAKDNSIRIVKPDLTLTPPLKLKNNDSKKDTTSYSIPISVATNTMRGSNQIGEGSRSRSQSKTMNEHSRSHSRSLSRHKQSFDAPRGHGRSGDQSTGVLIPKSDLSIRNGSMRSESVDRGRTMQRRYEFIDSDDKAHTVLSPVQETGKKDNGNGDDEGITNMGRESNMTTVTDLMHRCKEVSPPKLPARQNHRQQEASGNPGSSAVQTSLPQAKTKRRPSPLNLKDPVYLGRVRHTDRYEIEHIAIKSSKAELFGCYNPKSSSSIYDDRIKNPPRIPPLDIPSLDKLRGVDALQLYDEWRKNLKPVRTASQSSIHVTIPSRKEDSLNGKRVDQDQLPIVDYPIVQNTPIVNHMRSRSTLGIREDRDREQRHRQFSAYTASEYSATPLDQGPGIARSATMHDVPHSGRQFSNGSGLKDSQHGVMLNDAPKAVEMAMLSSPFTPLTPFIMKATGAPNGVERGSKTLFGEHGWLEDTAASGMTKPKMEKMGGFVESLKRKARELADSTSFKPARNIRTSAVNRMTISLNAREQSLLYCELEYNLNNALDAYVKAQLNSGRLEASKLSRIAELWAQKGRPKVVSFRYDLETQVDLITAHIDNFRFYGPLQAGGPAAITGLLHAMKINARYMRVRTFCQPDSVIAKHVLDAQNLLRLLGSPESLQRPLEEVAQFFKVAVDRHKAMTEAPASRHGGGRAVSKASGRVISNGSEQRVRFRDENGERPRQYAGVAMTSKSRTDVRDPDCETMPSRSVKPEGQDRNIHPQRP